MKKLPKLKGRKKIYKGRVLDLDLETFQFEGKQLKRETIVHPGSVVIIPELPDKRILLIKQYRHTCRKMIWELPAGTREKLKNRIENPRRCALRETQEEVGYRPGRLRKLCSFYLAPGTSTEYMHVFLASELTPRQLPKDADEIIQLKAFSKKEIMKMIQGGRIVDVKTIAALLNHFYC